MCVELEDLTRAECTEGGGGIVIAYWAYAKDIATFPALKVSPNENVLDGNIVMAATKYFRRIYLDEDKGKIDFVVEGTPGNLSLRANIEMRMSLMNKVRSRILDSNINGAFVLLIKDGTGATYCIGHPEGRTAKRNTATSTTGTALADPNEDVITFTCAIGKRIYYEGTIPTAP
jgi:hypothetical protein